MHIVDACFNTRFINLSAAASSTSTTAPIVLAVSAAIMIVAVATVVANNRLASHYKPTPTPEVEAVERAAILSEIAE